MNLYLRLIWTLLRAWRLPALALTDTVEREMRVYLNDIDLNLHMNNGRYMTVADLMTVEYFARTGFLRALIRNKWRPMLGGSIITYRKQLKLGQEYRLRYRWVGSDEYWNYLFFEFLTMDGQISATGYCKGAAVSSRGLVPTERCFEALAVEKFNQDLPPAVINWKQSEAALIAR